MGGKKKLCKDCGKIQTTTTRCYKCTLERKKAKNKKKREKKASKPKAMRKKCDVLWVQKAKEYYGEDCNLCGKTEYVQVHHYIGRRNLATRWMKENAIPLCSGCHTMNTWSAHSNPEWFRTQMLEIRGADWLKKVVKQSNIVFDKNYDRVKNYLESL